MKRADPTLQAMLDAKPRERAADPWAHAQARQMNMAGGLNVAMSNTMGSATYTNAASIGR